VTPTAGDDAERSDEEERRIITGPLDGIRVLELGTLIAGPFAGRLLGDMGADVIKVEPPGAPDPLRTWGQAEGSNQSSAYVCRTAVYRRSPKTLGAMR